jgi:CubicO group peptidase (beta-lactamase class C family)
MLKTISLTHSLLFSALLLTGCGGGGSKSTPPPVVVDDNDVVVVIDEFAALKTTAVADLAASNATALSVAIMKGGELVYAQAWGTKTANGTENVSTDTLFQIGSTTKVFTALATLQLVDENVLTLDQTLPQALPTLELSGQHAGWQDISMQHLLTHQGGFDDVVDWSPGQGLMDYALNVFPATSGQMNPAGKFWNYSNSNWSYLGAVIEHQRNQPYEQVMKNNVFEPLGMTRTTMSYDAVKSDGDYAIGYGRAVVNGQVMDANAENLEQISQPAFGKPAGGYTWSTASELVKMGDFLINGNTDVLPDALRQQISTTQVDIELGLPTTYGYGLFVRGGIQKNQQWFEEPLWEHGGNTLNYTSIFWVLPEQDITIAVLSSGESTNFSATMAAAVDAVASLPAPSTSPLAPVATELYDNHVGQYQFDDGVVTVFEEDGKLKMDMPAMDAAGISYDSVLDPYAGSVFFATINGRTMDFTFFADEVGGQSTYIRNRSFVGIRLNSTGLSFARPAANASKMIQVPLRLN